MFSQVQTDKLNGTSKEIWFGIYSNYYSNNETKYASGFEHIFVGEFDNDSKNVGGYHFWAKFYWDENGEINAQSKVNYYGLLYKGSVRNKGRINRDIATLVMRWKDNGIKHWVSISGLFGPN